jgi:hypothetical protein
VDNNYSDLGMNKSGFVHTLPSGRLTYGATGSDEAFLVKGRGGGDGGGARAGTAAVACRNMRQRWAKLGSSIDGGIAAELTTQRRDASAEQVCRTLRALRVIRI